MPEDLDTWKTTRKAALEAEDGWLNLVARLDLPFGEYRAGSEPDCELRLPSGPAHLGTISHGPGGVAFTAPGDAPQNFRPAPGGFPQLKVPPFLLEFHDPGDQPALRVRDLTQPRRAVLAYFPVDPDWMIEADWVPIAAPQEVEIGQSGAANTNVTVTHEARFRHQGTLISLVPTHWKSGKPMFVIRDATSGKQTYAASRFLIPEPAEAGRITLDFNRAHNPPCAFTDLAICPLPPHGNVLPFAVTAGELMPGFRP